MGRTVQQMAAGPDSEQHFPASSRAAGVAMEHAGDIFFCAEIMA